MIINALYGIFALLSLLIIIIVLNLPSSSSGAGDFSTTILDKFIGSSSNIPLLQRVVMFLFLATLAINIIATRMIFKANKAVVPSDEFSTITKALSVKTPQEPKDNQSKNPVKPPVKPPMPVKPNRVMPKKKNAMPLSVNTKKLKKNKTSNKKSASLKKENNLKS